MNTNTIAIGAVFVALGAALIAFAIPLETPRHIPYGPDLFPNIVGIGMIVFGSVALIRAWNGSDPDTDEPSMRGIGLPVLGFVATPILFVLAAPVFGYLIVMPLLLGGLITLLRGRWLSSFAIGIVIALVLQILFQQLMLVPLPWGLLEPYAGILTWT